MKSFFIYGSWITIKLLITKVWVAREVLGMAGMNEWVYSICSGSLGCCGWVCDKTEYQELCTIKTDSYFVVT